MSNSEKDMNRMRVLSTIVLIAIAMFSCNYETSNDQLEFVTIKGNIEGLDGSLLYVKMIEPISYNGNSLIDSVTVGSGGGFEFKIEKKLPLLLNISKHRGQHPIHDILIKDPDMYYYGYCSMFYVPEPTLYLTENSNIQLDWKVAERMDSYSFDLSTAENQDRFYDYYYKENIGRWLHEEDGNYKLMDPCTAWQEIQHEMNEVLDEYQVCENAMQSEFNDYLQTEIRLGTINKYANWYEYVFYDDLKKGFVSGDVPASYVNIFNLYQDSKWNTNSVEFYKMTERFINFNMNKSIKWYSRYYPTDDRKVSMARELLESSLADIYIENIIVSDSIDLSFLD